MASAPNKENPKRLAYKDLRSDWYASNQTMARAARFSLEGRRNYIFVGFPRQWIPVFEYFGLNWRSSIKPIQHTPFFSDLSENSLISIIGEARIRGTLRILLESASMYDPVISDFLYIVDNSTDVRCLPTSDVLNDNGCASNFLRPERILLNGWQSYGRASVRLLENKAQQIPTKGQIAVVLPCSRARPYYRSKTHKRIYRILSNEGYDITTLHKIVITSLGVIPEELWSAPEVLAYDAGVPDIYRILRLLRAYFSKHRYTCVLDCLEFPPYSDLLRIAVQEGMIHSVKKMNIPKQRSFFVRP